MRHGSLFSGIGGFDLAAEWIGWENVFHCEWNEFGQKILKHYWPKAISYDDITKTDFTIHRGKIDILTGGFPCQPYSLAGKRKGKEDDRHLWPEMLRAIREIQPSWIVGENVSGLINWNGGLVFEEVQADLENEGYEVWTNVLPAASVNAPHKRDRVWFVAYDTSSNRRNGKRQSSENENRESESRKVRELEGRSEGFCSNGITANTNHGNREEKRFQTGREINMDFFKGKGISSNSTSKRGNKNNRIGKPRQFNEKSQINDWENFPTESPICNGNDGFPSKLDGITFSKWRNESIKGGGNAIVPQVAYQIFKTVNMMFERQGSF